MCLYPKLIQNKKYVANKKNGGVIPPIFDKRVLAVPIGCGKCMECKKKKKQEWSIRLHEEIRHDNTGKFVTLTFTNEQLKNIIQGKDTKGKEITKPLKLKGYELDNEIATIAVRRFLERWRKNNKKSVKHWLVTELGHINTERIHLHGIIWTTKSNEEISKAWQYGIITIGKRKYENGKQINNEQIGYVNEQTINYIVKYIQKTDIDHKYYNSKILTSKGIGKKYFNRTDHIKNKYTPGETNETYKNKQGYKMSLPMYYRNKIYTDEEREKLWLEKLDKNIRWINGEKINADNYEQIIKTLKYYRKENRQLGYGSNEKNYDEEKYENDIRNLKIWKILKEENQQKRK